MNGATTLTQAQTSPAPWRRLLLRWAPYVITAVVITALLHQFPLSEIAQHVQEGDWLPVIAIAAFSVIITLLLVAWADLLVIGGCCGEPSYASMLSAKAGSSLLDVFGYVAGHGAYAIWIYRFTGVRAALAGGAMLYIMASDLLSVCLVASVAAFAAPAGETESVRLLAPSIAAFLLLCIALGPREILGRGLPVFKPWAVIPRRVGLVQVAIRTAHICFWVLATWSAAKAFGLDIPLWAMATYFPLIMLVGSLPINVGGFGAVQGAWLLLAGHADPTQILAFNFVWTLVVSAALILRGLPFVRRVVQEVNGAEEAI